MTIEIVQGCIFEAFEKGEINYLVHQVNCQGKMGGLAGEVKRRYPVVYEHYIDMFHTKLPSPLLGEYQEVRVYPEKYVVNIFGQDNIGTHKRQTNYGALAQALIGWRDDHYIAEREVIGFPYKFGSGLGGADWNIVLEIIEFIFRDYNVKIYQL